VIPQYETLAWLLALWLFLATIAALADVLNAVHTTRARARHQRYARHTAAGRHLAYTHHQIRAPRRYPAAARQYER